MKIRENPLSRWREPTSCLEILWTPSTLWNSGSPRSVKIYQRITPRDVTQAFKNITWVFIMIPEICRPITSVKPEISWNPSKLRNSGPRRPTLRRFNLRPIDVPEPKAANASQLDTLTLAGRRDFYGFLWISMDFYWFFMDFMDFLVIFIDCHKLWQTATGNRKHELTEESVQPS